ncbi:PREDICTED: kinesin-like protein KIN-7M, chloroplastic [Camelina sativa]|uniref:Kinesin-like protein KIN-7M, chloroplastic n=1 Tax=Camelina sativa TaxID=90675 RepID=A0ABM0UT15_CAMSA|nr:PREDICTED: kinesin-like protein KIN-7M, chloroplastic [Camelina sativa]
MASRDHNTKEKNLTGFVTDRFNSCRAFPAEGSASNEEKNKEVLECSSRSTVLKTGEPLQIPSSNHNPTSSPLVTNSNPFCNPGQPETSSRNGVIIGASSLVQIWEARSQQSSSSLSQSLIDSRTSSGLSLSDISNSSSFSEFLNDVERKNNESSGEEIDWSPQSDMSNVSNSCENDREGRCFLELATCTTRVRGRQASEDVCKMILRNREIELEWLDDRNAVSKFSRRGCRRLQYMLRIRSLERCISIQERYMSKSATSGVNRSLRGSSVINHRDKYKTKTEKGSWENLNSAGETKKLSRPVSFRMKRVCKMACKTGDKNVLQEKMENSNTRKNYEAASNMNSSKKHEIEGKATEEGEGLRKATVKESEQTNKSSLSTAEKVTLWDSKGRPNRRRTMGKAKDEEKAARRVAIDVKTVERNKERRKNEEVSVFEKGKTMEIEEYRTNPQEVTSVACLEQRKEEAITSHIFRESGKEEKSSQNDEETSKAKKQEESETLCMVLETPIFLSGWDDNVTEYKDYEDYNGESMYYDWISDKSRPRSYWEALKKQRELELMNKSPEKDDMRNLIEIRTVSGFLAGDFREKIDKIMISRLQMRLEVESNLVEEDEDNEESLGECSARYQEDLEETETEKVDLEPITETQMICDLRKQIKQLQREMFELQSLVKSCVSFQKSMKCESLSVSDSLERNCSVCLEMPIDSLLYRCGHMCTCLKCAHELQWSSVKCPICMAPIVDVVRAFLDS